MFQSKIFSGFKAFYRRSQCLCTAQTVFFLLWKLNVYKVAARPYSETIWLIFSKSGSSVLREIHRNQFKLHDQAEKNNSRLFKGLRMRSAAVRRGNFSAQKGRDPDKGGGKARITAKSTSLKRGPKTRPAAHPVQRHHLTRAFNLIEALSKQCGGGKALPSSHAHSFLFIKAEEKPGKINASPTHWDLVDRRKKSNPLGEILLSALNDARNRARSFFCPLISPLSSFSGGRGDDTAWLRLGRVFLSPFVILD